MPIYDSDQFEPAAPLARVTLRSSDQKRTVTEVPMLLDTGADVSLVPHGAVKGLGLPEEPEARYRLLSFDGSPSSAPAYRFELDFCGKVFRGRFLLIDQDVGILFRSD